MTPDALADYLHEHIPLSRAMEVSVIGASADEVVIDAPLEPNINVHGTMFGGSAAVLGLLAAWSVMHLRLEAEGIAKFILITENVLNFHSGDKDYYIEWFEEATDENGWIVALNMPEATQQDFKKRKLNYFIELMQLGNWRAYKPEDLFTKINDEISRRLD